LITFIYEFQTLVIATIEQKLIHRSPIITKRYGLWTIALPQQRLIAFDDGIPLLDRRDNWLATDWPLIGRSHWAGRIGRSLSTLARKYVPGIKIIEATPCPVMRSSFGCHSQFIAQEKSR